MFCPQSFFFPLCSEHVTALFVATAFVLKALIIYVICHHLVCHWLNLLGLHFLVFTPTRAQALGWLYNLWHTFLSFTNIQVATNQNFTLYCYKLGSSVKWVSPICLSLSIFLIISCWQLWPGDSAPLQIVAVVILLAWSSQVFFKSPVR